mmetsp:Transcript_14371/g.14194  ORF Transcript_14371/g.14194 Transcript_14371/m.14194 type:complete len:84 (+) Transcript_14371:995-1246(+)
MLLPCPPRQPLVQYNLSELYSAPGRQAASMINSTHLRALETPLSAVATATRYEIFERRILNALTVHFAAKTERNLRNHFFASF